MNEITFKNLNEIKARYGTWSAVATSLGMEARSLRHIRRNMSKPAKHLISIKVRQLRLARTIQHLITSGQLTRAQFRRAWVEANKLP